MKNYLSLVLCILCLGDVSFGQKDDADPQATENQLKASIFEALKKSEDDWFKATSALKNETPDSFDQILSNIMQNHLEFTTKSEDGRRRYSGISELSIKRAIVFSLRTKSSTHAVASTIENIMSLEAEGKIATADQSKSLLELLFEYDDFSASGAMADVAKVYDVPARSQILDEVARRHDQKSLTKESSIEFLKRAFPKENDPKVLDQLNQLYLKLGAPTSEQE